MSFDTDENSAEGSQPREFYDITIGEPAVTTYRIASGARDLVVDVDGHTSVLYPASAVARSEISPATSSQGKELSLMLPVNHPFAKRWLQYGTPPVKTFCKVRRLQVVSGEIEQQWYGKIHSMGVDGNVAKFRVPSRATETMLRVVPTVTAGKTCPHFLFDSMCQLVRTVHLDTNGLALQFTTTVLAVNGREVRCSMLNVLRNGDWAANGELKHVLSGETMTIISQDDVSPGASDVTVLSMQGPIPGMKLGDSITVTAGCRKTMEICHSRFNNRQHFGGFNRMPTRNLWSPVDDHGNSTADLGELE